MGGRRLLHGNYFTRYLFGSLAVIWIAEYAAACQYGVLHEVCTSNMPHPNLLCILLAQPLDTAPSQPQLDVVLVAREAEPDKERESSSLSSTRFSTPILG